VRSGEFLIDVLLRDVINCTKEKLSRVIGAEDPEDLWQRYSRMTLPENWFRQGARFECGVRLGTVFLNSPRSLVSQGATLMTTPREP
jgi:hypothetical protein